jgi:putative hydrolase of the HAD superfamily
MKRAVLFDLGNTLAQYYVLPEYPHLLRAAIRSCADYLYSTHGVSFVEAELAARVQAEDHEAPDYRVRPLEERLVRIFPCESSLEAAVWLAVCRRFMEPIFALGVCYPDTIPTLRQLRREGYRLAIVSNSPWGSPAELWREELDRLGLSNEVDEVVFCRDVGWRKPAAAIFEYVMQRLECTVEESVFVGDDPRWDLVGPRSIGMDAILIDRDPTRQTPPEQPIRSLVELPDRIRLLFTGNSPLRSVQ